MAALAGAVDHARSHVENGVDIVIAQGYEAGGHTGEIASMVLVPEIVDAIGDSAGVLAAGGIGSGRKVAAALALGASGVWMGSYWLTTSEYKLGSAADGPSSIQRALLGATSADTVRSRIYSGKPARLLKTKGPTPGPSPTHPTRCRCRCRTSSSAKRISASRRETIPRWWRCPVGQIVGRMNEIRPVAEIMAELVAGYDATVSRLDGLKS